MFYVITVLGIIIALIFGVITMLKMDEHCNDE